MARRFIKTVTIDSGDNINPKIVGIVSTGSNIQSEAKVQKYFKRNYLDVLKKITPAFYFADDALISGTSISPPNQLINSHLMINSRISSLFPCSALTYDKNLSAIDTPTGFARFFYKQNSPASIAPDDFERNILYPLGAQFNQFDNSAAFLHYVSGTLLPKIPLINDDYHTTENLATLTTSAFSNDSSGTYSYLVQNLGWVYFLNRYATLSFGPSEPLYDTSGAVAKLLAENLWRGRSIELVDSLNIFEEYIWNNEGVIQDSIEGLGGAQGIIPKDYVSGTSTSAGTYTSGTQLVDRLKTLNEVVYSPHYLDLPDRKVEESFDTYLSTGSLITETEEAGDFTKLLRGISFSLADRVTEGNEINALYDLANCPDQYLELLAELIGWRLIGVDVSKWRVQLRNAVEIYKKKGTKVSIQMLMDTLFSTGVFNITSDDVITELWESYIPDIIYYSLATSSEAFVDGFNSYTAQVAHRFGAPYSPTDMDMNIKYLVDKILFELVQEFPTNFKLGKTFFPRPVLTLSGTDTVYKGDYHVHDQRSTEVSSRYMTGEQHSDKSLNLEIKYDPNFTFFYRNRINYIPPYEKRQYYSQVTVSPSLLDKIEALLSCYGVSKDFAKTVVNYIRSYTTQTMEPLFALNGFLLFTKERTHPPNYSLITKYVTKERTPDPATLLTMWNGKSSHFFMSFDASSFVWDTASLDYNTHYSLKKVSQVLDEVIPAHAIPATLLTVSSVDDSASGVRDTDCREVRPNFSDLYEGSSTVTTNFATSAVDMDVIATRIGLSPHKFKRQSADNINDPLFASGLELIDPGDGMLNFIPVRRNSLRRRNYHYLLPETKMFTRIGRNNPGSLELSTTYYSSATGYIPLGFIPSALKYQPVALTDPSKEGAPSKFGPLLDHPNVHAVWDICENLVSPNAYFNYDVSNTFASRAKQDVTSSDCNTYGRRGQLPEILYMMNKLNDKAKYIHAETIVSGYFLANGEINPLWPSSTPHLTPNDLSAWYEDDAHNANVIRSMGNQLINNEIRSNSLHYLEHFKFGRSVNKLFSNYITSSIYAGHGIRNNYNELGGPNVFSHTYGPLIYNSDFDVDGSAVIVSGFLQSSSVTDETDISYYAGSGVLSISGTSSAPTTYVGTVAASDADDVYLGYNSVSSPDFRNQHLASGIELVDTSANSGGPADADPAFSIFKLARPGLTQFTYSNFLIDNTVIKYQRSDKLNTLPRLRIKLDNSDESKVAVKQLNKAKNFLEPNHRYEINILAHNVPVNDGPIGGQTLGVWVHTEPEDGKIWSYRAYGYDKCGKYQDAWEQLDVTSLCDNGINMVTADLADIKKFPIKPPSGGKTKGGPKLGGKYILCWDKIKQGRGGKIIDMNPPITRINNETRTSFTYRLTTNNDKGSHPSPAYENKYGPIHRLDQKYVIEVFLISGDKDKIIVFEKIALMDLTNNSMAAIPTQYGVMPLDEFDLKTTFRYWKDLERSTASRNLTITSGTMEVSGGRRLNYRSNIGMYPNTRDAVFGQLTQVDIHEG